MIDLYDSELPKVGKVAQDLNQKWNFLARRLDGATGTKFLEALNVWSEEVEKRFAEIGLIAKADVSPAFMNSPPSVTIEGRIDKHEFDHEKMGWEIKKGKS